MRALKSTLLAAVIIAVAIGALKLGATYWTTVRDDLDEKAEWSILQAAYQTNKNKKSDACSPIHYVYKDSKAIGFWSSQGWVWILVPSHAGGGIKVLPEGAKFYLPRAGIEAAIADVGDPGVVKYIRDNSVPGCP